GLYRKLYQKEQTAHANIAKLKEINQTLNTHDLDTDVHLLCQHLNAMRIH
ncbi:MAG: hypothetical protein ACI8WB_003538, partial [Phenylobacterium sp.]